MENMLIFIIPFLKIQLKVMKTTILLILSIVLTFPVYGEKLGLASMVLIQKGSFQMGSKKSMLELKPHDLFNTDRHTLGPENPAHEIYLDSFYCLVNFQFLIYQIM